MSPPQAKPKKQPKLVAIIDEEGCTGCEVCLYYCPVPDCIVTIPGPEFPGVNAVCRVREELCIGCAACVRPCPWETIAMAPPLQPLLQRPETFGGDGKNSLKR